MIVSRDYKAGYTIMYKKFSIAMSILAGLSFNSALKAAEHGDVVSNMAEAVRYSTISYQDRQKINYKEFDGFLQFLRSTYPLVFSELRIEVVSDYSLIITWQGKDAGLNPILFDAHYDVVPVEVGTEHEWSYPAFDGTVADGYLWGRGSIDDKASVIAYLESVEALLKEKYQPDRTLVFSIAHDEEVGGENGAANIAKQFEDRGINFEYMVAEGGLVIEGHPLVESDFMALIALAEKTFVTVTLRVSGKGGHSSTPVKDNAIARLAEAVNRLHNNPLEPQLVSPVTDMLEVIGEQVGGFKGFMMKNQWLSEPLLIAEMTQDEATNALVRSTTAVTMFNAGIKANVIPQKAEAKVNFRLLPGYTPEQLVKDVKGIIDDAKVEVDYESWKPSPEVADMNGEGYARLKSVISEVLPEVTVVPGMMTATTDSPHYANLTKNIYRFHPYTLHADDVDKVHGTDERISIKSLKDAVTLSKALIKSAARP
jgi:carboxypeptidase PM20D1